MICCILPIPENMWETTVEIYEATVENLVTMEQTMLFPDSFDWIQ